MSATFKDLSDNDETPILGTDDAFDRAQSLAHDPDALDQLQADDEIVRRATRALTLGGLL